MNNKGDSTTHDNTSAAEDILKQFHPELYHKRQLEAGKGKGDSGPPPEVQKTAPPVIAAPPPKAKLHAAPKKSAQTPWFLSPSEITFRFSNFVRDLVDFLSSLAASSFLRYIINVYTVIAVVVLVPSGYAAYKWWTKPPYFIAEECMKTFTEVHTEFSRMRTSSASPAEWDEFVEESKEEIDDMVYNLSNTRDVRQRERQVLSWMGGYLQQMLDARMGDISNPEKEYQTLITEMARLKRDREKQWKPITY
ncbi:MAG: hypothetical protein R3C11_19040 [Planctomycetaceae bacterium]